MNILFLVGGSGGYNGPTRFALTLSRYLSVHRSAGIVFCCDYVDPAVVLEMSSAVKWWHAPPDKAKQVVQEQVKHADCIITSGVPALSQYIGSKPQIPVICVSHCSGEWEEQAKMVREECKIAHFNVGVSECAARAFPAELYPNVSIVPNGIEFDRVLEYAGRDAMRHAWQVDREAKVALFLGRMAKIKRPELMIDIAKELAKRGPWSVVMVGDGPLQRRIEKRIGRLGHLSVVSERVRLCPPTRHVGDCYAASDVLVVPSDSEAMPLTVLEAWSAGLPVVTRDHDFADEIQRRHAPACMRAVTGDDPAEWASQIVEASTDTGMVRHANSVAKNFYSATGMAFRWDSFLSEVSRTWYGAALKPQSVIHVAPSKRRLHVVWDKKGWAYWHRAKALEKYAPENWIVTHSDGVPENPSNVDAVFLLRYSLASEYRQWIDTYCPHAYLFGGVNSGPGRNKKQVQDLLKHSDAVIHNNWRSYESLMHDKTTRNYQISNGVDLDQFVPTNAWEYRRPTAGWIGSKVHEKLKGYDLLSGVAEELNKADNHYHLNGQLGTPIPISAILVDSSNPPHSHDELSQWYNELRVFLVLSGSEGTPNPALEAAACGCVLVATDVGNMPELIEDGVNGFLIPVSERENFALVAAKIKQACQNGEAMREESILRIQEWSWELRAARYFELLEAWILGKPPGQEWNIKPALMRKEVAV